MDTIEYFGMQLNSDRPSPSVLVVRVAGELDMLTVPSLNDHVRDQTTQEVRHVILDFAGATFMGSSALAMLVELARTSREARLHLTGVHDNKRVARSLEISGLLNILNIHGDLADLQTALRDGEKGRTA